MLHYATFVFLIVFSTLLVGANKIVVSPSGEYKTVKKAIETAQPGDTVWVENGTYPEYEITVDKPVTIIGEELAIIDAQKRGYIFNITADSVSIIGLTLNNVGVSFTKDYAAIHTHNVSNFWFEGITFNNPFFAFHIERSTNGTIKNNIINGNAVLEHDSGNGIHLWHSSNIEILSNKIFQMRDGIYFEFVKHSKVIGNESKRNVRYGLHFMFSNDDEYKNNVFENNGAGVAVMFSKKIFMRNNTFQLNWGSASYGLLLKEIYDADIRENEFVQNTIGINAEGSNRVSLEKNNFMNNGWAIKFLGGCYGNKFIENNFMHNSFDVSYHGNINGNLFDKNYWSEYVGYDLDKDGIGDVPFRPVKLFSYVVNQTPETIVLLRSLFVDLINFSEKVSPVFTPDNLRDNHPLMRPVK
ncbi:MAG: nitrous oxide reductase family maturation protein NosD [Calditrichaeota bacterium]|nr:nitrous oxide reductase family maturation protein NosD [Calditrichota bacterium]HQU71312.1 nitrous oxide reductase family maturation protein NosD [Calditrichia bacterium]